MTLDKYFNITTIKTRANRNNGAAKQLCRDKLDLVKHENNKILETSSKNIHSSKDITKNVYDSNSNDDFLNQRKDNKIEDLSIVKHIEKNVLYNPKVLIEKLPEHVLKKTLLNKENINVQFTNKNGTANLCVRVCENCKKTISNCNLKTTMCCPKCKNALIYECKKCKKHTASYTGMLYHLRTSCQSQGHYYQCPGCPYKSAIKVFIKDHMQRLHKNLSVSDMKIIATEDMQNDIKNSEIHVHKCSKCGQQFRQLNYLNLHLKACGNLKYRVSFTGENEVGNENEDSNSSGKPVPVPDTLNVVKMAVLYCEKCDKKIPINDNVYGCRKCNNCKSNLLFECTKCGKQYKSAKGIIYHFKAKCAAQEIMYCCSKCYFKHPVKNVITEHYKKIHESDSAECPKCKSILKNKGTLMKHLNYCGKKAYLQCDLCSYKTNNRTTLRIHIKRHEYNDNQIEANCPKCKKILKNAFTLRSHLYYCGKEPRFQCTICVYKCVFKKGLREHMIRMHFKDKNKYPACPKCSAKFEYKHCANAHLRFCGMSKPHFQCDYCPYKCKRKDEIKSHITRLHLRSIDNNDDSDVDVVN